MVSCLMAVPEDAHQLGFDQGIQNALFLQDLIDQAIQMIWSLREERRQLEVGQWQGFQN